MPFELTLVVTHHCNLNCIYCYEHNKTNKKRMSFTIAQNTLQHYLTTGTYDEIRIGFIGGEPLLEFDLIKDICEWVWSNKWNKKFIFYATTNGTIMTSEMRNWFTNHRQYFWLTLSLDGTRETHNRNRCNSFDKIDLEFFKINWPNQPVKMTISDSHLDTLAEDVIFIHNKGFEINGCNFAEGIEMIDFDRKIPIIANQYEKLIDYYLNHPEHEARIFQLPLAECEFETKEHKKRCGTGENMAVIDFDGKIYPCTFFSPVSMDSNQLQNVLNIDFTDINNFIDNLCCNDCYIYPICHGCYGDNYVITGKMASRSKQKCELNKLKAVAVAKFQAQYLLRELNKTNEISIKAKRSIIAIQKINELFVGNQCDLNSPK